MLSGETKLYDLRNRDYPNKRGDSFRSLQVFECWVCGALSNEVVMGGWPGYGVRVICPNACECWHHALEDSIKALDESFDRKMKELRLPFLNEIKDDYVPIDGDGDAVLKKNEEIRTKTPYRCGGCGALTNRIIIKENQCGNECMAMRCLQHDKVWHRELVEKFKEFSEQDEKVKQFLRKSCTDRETVKNDLVGNPDRNLKKWMTNVRSWKLGQRCDHL